MEKVCNLDCFCCIYPDCIRDEPEKKRYPNYQSGRDWLKRRYYRWKAAGLCVRCGKREAKRGVHCIDCYTARKRYDHGRNCTGIRTIWKSSGKCVHCGADVVQGKLTCPRHYAIAAAGAEKARNSEGARQYRERMKLEDTVRIMVARNG